MARQVRETVPVVRVLLVAKHPAVVHPQRVEAGEIIWQALRDPRQAVRMVVLVRVVRPALAVLPGTAELGERQASVVPNCRLRWADFARKIAFAPTALTQSRDAAIRFRAKETNGVLISETAPPRPPVRRSRCIRS